VKASESGWGEGGGAGKVSHKSLDLEGMGGAGEGYGMRHLKAGKDIRKGKSKGRDRGRRSEDILCNRGFGCG